MYLFLRDAGSCLFPTSDSEFQGDLLISFHGIGDEFRGVLGCSACYFRREETEEEQWEIREIAPACKELFQFNYKESIEQASERFNSWMNDVETVGLELWRSSLS